MQKTVADIPFFFIIGRPRSGTYLLRSLFDAHPNVTIPTECPMIVNLYPKYGHKTSWQRKDLLRFYHDVCFHGAFRKWDLDKEKLKESLLNYEGKHRFQTLIKVVYLHSESSFPKEDISLIGDKNPVYSTNTEKVLKAFPEAKYIHLTRDYRDNLHSIKKVDFEAPYVPLIAYRWMFSARKILKIKQAHPDQFLTIRYEDLVSAPKKHWKEIADFLGIHYDESVFDFYKYRDASFKNHPDKEVKKYHQSLSDPINTKKIGVWRKTLSEKEVRMCDYVVGKYAELSGYERKFKESSIQLKIKSFPGKLYGRSSFLFGDFLDILPFRIRVKIKEGGSILAFIYHKIFG